MRWLVPIYRDESLAFVGMSITEKLIDQCKRNKTRAQIELFKLCYPQLMPVCKRYVKEDEAAAMLNLGFYKVLKGVQRYEFSNEIVFMHWAKRVVINAIIDELRKQKKYKDQHTAVDHLEINGMATKASYNAAALHMDAEHIHNMIAKLAPVQQTVFNLYVVDGYVHKEIAERLEMSENTSRWYLAQARKELQAMLAVYSNQQIKVKA